MNIRVGCCGFPVGKTKYFYDFDIVELQQTFYQPPESSLAVKWRNESPKDFEYTVKAWQLMTHDPKSPTYRKLKLKIPESKARHFGSFKPTEEIFQAWAKTKKIADILNAKIIVFQCPASFEPTGENKHNMQKFFSTIKREKFILAWEPRGKWAEKDIESVCKELDLMHVGDPFKSKTAYGKIRYYRLHGIGGYKYKYTNADLRKLLVFSETKKDSFFMFNNVFMYEDAREFRNMIKGEKWCQNSRT